MSKQFKVLLLSIFTLFVSFIIYIGTFGPEGYCLFEPYIDTRMAKNFTPEKFNLIEKGFTKKEVIQIIGKPLSSKIDTIGNQIIEFYRYTGDGAISDLDKIPWYIENDHAWYACYIKFDKQQKVVEVIKYWARD